MKKTLKKLFIVLLALGFVVGFASCKKATGDNNNTEQDGNSDTTQQGGDNNGGDNNGGDNNGGDNNGGNEQGGDNNGGSTTAAGAWYSYEITLKDGTVYSVGSDGKITGKKTAAGETAEFDEMDQAAVDLSFIKITFTSALWTEFNAGGTDTWDESLAEYCTVTKDGDKYTLEMAGTPMIELTAANGEYTATYADNSYKFKKA